MPWDPKVNLPAGSRCPVCEGRVQERSEVERWDIAQELAEALMQALNMMKNTDSEHLRVWDEGRAALRKFGEIMRQIDGAES